MSSGISIDLYTVPTEEAELNLLPTDDAGLRAALGLPSPRDLPSPHLQRACTHITQILNDEEKRAYKAAIASSLDTELPCTPVASKRRPVQQQQPAESLSFLPQITPRSGEDQPREDESPSVSRCYREGTKLAASGMDLEAAHLFLGGLSHAPQSTRLRVAFDVTLQRARCSCRPHGSTAYAQPCPEKRRYKKEGVDSHIRGVTWSQCPACGAMWPDKPKMMRRVHRVNRGTVDEVQVEEEPEEEEETGPSRSKEIEDFLSSFNFDDLLPRDPKVRPDATGPKKGASRSKGEGEGEGKGRRAAERAAVEEVLVRHYPDFKAIHAHYSNQAGATLDECLGASAFTMDQTELKIFLEDCYLLDKALSNMDLKMIFMRVNWTAEQQAHANDDTPLVGSAKYNNFDDSQTELTVSEFAHLLLRVSQARLPHRKKAKNVASHFVAMVEEHVLPHAQRDSLAFLRETISSDKRLRHAFFMHRKKLSAIFRKYCGPAKNDRNDKTSRDHMSMRAFTQVVSSCGLQAKAGLEVKQVTLVFLQAQSEDYDQYEGAIDNEMTLDEFQEALLRIAVQWAGGPDACRGDKLRDALLPVLRLVCGELEGGATKLDWDRLQELISDEVKRVEQMKKDMMWDEFEVIEGQMPKGPDEQTQYWMGAEAIFKRMLDALEREGDAEAGKALLPKKPGKKSLFKAGKAVRLGVKMGAAQNALSAPRPVAKSF